MARFVTGRGFVRSRGFIARELNVGSALCIFYGAGSDRRTIYIYIYIYYMDCEQPYRLCGARSGSPQLWFNRYRHEFVVIISTFYTESPGYGIISVCTMILCHARLNDTLSLPSFCLLLFQFPPPPTHPPLLPLSLSSAPTVFSCSLFSLPCSPTGS